MKDQKKAEDIAAQRVQLLSPLLADGLDPAKADNQRQIFVSKPVYLSEPYDGIWLSIEEMDSTV